MFTVPIPSIWELVITLLLRKVSCASVGVDVVKRIIAEREKQLNKEFFRFIGVIEKCR